jgi:hypothetical protein
MCCLRSQTITRGAHREAIGLREIVNFPQNRFRRWICPRFLANLRRDYARTLSRRPAAGQHTPLRRPAARPPGFDASTSPQERRLRRRLKNEPSPSSSGTGTGTGTTMASTTTWSTSNSLPAGGEWRVQVRGTTTCWALGGDRLASLAAEAGCKPQPIRLPRPRPGPTNATSARSQGEERNRCSRSTSGNPRSPSNYPRPDLQGLRSGQWITTIAENDEGWRGCWPWPSAGKTQDYRNGPTLPRVTDSIRGVLDRN